MTKMTVKIIYKYSAVLVGEHKSLKNDVLTTNTHTHAYTTWHVHASPHVDM